MTVSVIVGRAMPWNWTSFATGAAAGMFGGPLVRPLIKNVLIRPLATIGADATDLFHQARAENAAATMMSGYMAIPQGYVVPQAAGVAAARPVTAPAQGGWMYVPCYPQPATTAAPPPQAHTATAAMTATPTGQTGDLATVLNMGFQHLMEALNDIGGKVDALRASQQGHQP